MIPATIDPETPSPGERDAFSRLESDPLAEQWIVIHSLNLPHHQRQISGELDFVLLVPNKGVLCLEIKAARTVACRDGLWFYGREGKGDPRGPFRQAADGMHSLRERLIKRRPESSRRSSGAGSSSRTRPSSSSQKSGTAGRSSTALATGHGRSLRAARTYWTAHGSCWQPSNPRAGLTRPRRFQVRRTASGWLQS